MTRTDTPGLLAGPGVATPMLRLPGHDRQHFEQRAVDAIRAFHAGSGDPAQEQLATDLLCALELTRTLEVRLRGIRPTPRVRIAEGAQLVLPRKVDRLRTELLPVVLLGFGDVTVSCCWQSPKTGSYLHAWKDDDRPRECAEQWFRLAAHHRGSPTQHVVRKGEHLPLPHGDHEGMGDADVFHVKLDGVAVLLPRLKVPESEWGKPIRNLALRISKADARVVKPGSLEGQMIARRPRHVLR